MSQPSDFKPLLSAKIETDVERIMLEQLGKLHYPMIASPKLDGIRVFIHPQLGAVTRTLKQVPNRHIFNTLSQGWFTNLDGEVTIGPPSVAVDPTTFNATQSGVMSFDGQPEFTFWAFDDAGDPLAAYQLRLNAANERVGFLKASFIRALEYTTAKNTDEVLEIEASYLARGFEGIMLRSPHAGYKYGRSTLKQQHLIKMKRMADAEAIVIDTRPLFENHNVPTVDNLGHQKRSAHQAGRVETSMLGTLVCMPTDESGFTQHFEIGSGFDDSTRSDLWARRSDLIGRRVVFKYQATGVKDKPRFPIYKGFRED